MLNITGSHKSFVASMHSSTALPVLPAASHEPHLLQVRRQLALPEQRQQRGGQVAPQLLRRSARARRCRPPSRPYGTNSSDLTFSLRAPAALSACGPL